ncbi:hypothetical protein CK203_058470 [Vitis vinifera]|uniref:PGG domain-containing protein n=1 Tax=Vitis vinifera TaxID=29760 RepID=A0A438H1B9_VITVI|nr:hypothetical protein CK203_058470 [Vitis vinifera]
MHLTKPLNKDNQTAEELFAARNERLHRDAKEWLMRTTENCTILSIFIATVAFAAAYTVPGGPNQNTGIPILNSKPFFVVFILADVFSLTLALTSVADTGNYMYDLSVSMMAVAFGATIILIMTHNWTNAVWSVVGFLPVPIFTSTFSSPGTLHRIFQNFVAKFLKGVAIGYCPHCKTFALSSSKTLIRRTTKDGNTILHEVATSNTTISVAEELLRRDARRTQTDLELWVWAIRLKTKGLIRGPDQNVLTQEETG